MVELEGQKSQVNKNIIVAMKRYVSFVVLILNCYFSIGQIDKLGFTRSEIINSTDGDPCKSSYDAIWYCGENGSRINYGFEGNTVTSVLYMWEFPSKYEADADVRNEISKYTAEFGRPEMKNGQAFWFVGDNLIMISYGYTNGNHYSTWRVSGK